MSDPDCDESDNFDELIFKRELNEVYLLLDYISGRPDAHIWNLDVDVPVEQNPDIKETPFNLYLRISTMRYPPERSATIKAYDATILLYVKDRLNSIAAPARGSTIAYTYIYLAEDNPLKLKNIPNLEGGKKPSQTKASVASDAFPGLVASAMRLRRKRIGITTAGILAFILAMCFLCWTVYGSMILKRFEDDRKSALDLEKSVYAQVATDASANKQIDQDIKDNVAQICCWTYPGSLTSTAKGLCGTWSYYQARYDKAIADAGAFANDLSFLTFFLPTEHVQPTPSTAECPARTHANVVAFEKATGKSVIGEVGSDDDLQAHSATKAEAASMVGASNPTMGNRDEARFRQEDVQSVGLIVSVYSTYVLPIFFGFVGTVASFLRNTGNKALTSTLAPRERV